MHPQAVALKLTPHQRLRAGLVAQQRGLGHQLTQQRHRLVALGGHGVDDLGFAQRVEGGGVHAVWPLKVERQWTTGVVAPAVRKASGRWASAAG